MFVFIILHYKTTNATIECINSINNSFKNDNKVIIIVDNNSPNSSGKVLEEAYKEYSNIIILLNNQNLGYARGFNTGIRYAVNNYDYDFIILLNNDTEICGTNWEKTIVEKYNKYKFHVLGPDIIALDNSHGNPMVESIDGIPDLLKKMSEHLLDLITSFLYLNSHVDRLKEFVKKAIHYYPADVRVINKDNLNVQLHGSCLILSRLFFEKYDGLFSDTFLYYEEEILRYMARRDGLSLVYTPQIIIIHKEGLATNCDFNTKRKKDIFFNINCLKSCVIFLKLMIKDKNQKHYKIRKKAKEGEWT